MPAERLLRGCFDGREDLVHAGDAVEVDASGHCRTIGPLKGHWHRAAPHKLPVLVLDVVVVVIEHLVLVARHRRVRAVMLAHSRKRASREASQQSVDDGHKQSDGASAQRNDAGACAAR